MKIKYGLYNDFEQDNKTQDKLREKYHEEDKKVRIVEKPMVGKFIVRAVGEIIRIACLIALIALAAVGLIAILYPQSRADLVFVLNDVLRQIRIMLHL